MSGIPAGRSQDTNWWSRGWWLRCFCCHAIAVTARSTNSKATHHPSSMLLLLNTPSVLALEYNAGMSWPNPYLANLDWTLNIHLLPFDVTGSRWDHKKGISMPFHCYWLADDLWDGGSLYFVVLSMMYWPIGPSWKQGFYFTSRRLYPQNEGRRRPEIPFEINFAERERGRKECDPQHDILIGCLKYSRM